MAAMTPTKWSSQRSKIGRFAPPGPNNRSHIPSLFARRSGAREEFEVKDKSVAFAASGGERFALVLEFEFLSRIIASMQSMRRCRQAWRLLAMCSFAHLMRRAVD
jgi:hypothetical protein